MIHEWVYRPHQACWYDYVTQALGFPNEGDWYLDYDEWRIW